MGFSLFINKFLNKVWLALWLCIRPSVKWVLRRCTRMCELVRICYGTLPGAERSIFIEYSLNQSRNFEIKKSCKYLNEKVSLRQLSSEDIHYIVYSIIRIKNIDTTSHPRFRSQLLSSIGSIWGYQQLLTIVEATRKTKCMTPNSSSSVCDPHAVDVTERLQRLWCALSQEKFLSSIITKQWQDIGFQGADPCTDFRGMGLLGLENLLYFAENYKSVACHVLSRSCHPQYGYPFAVVGINMTDLARTLLQDGALKTHFYNTIVKDLREKVIGGFGGNAELHLPKLDHFHEIYCHLFVLFDCLWRNEKPKDTMEFSRIRNKFEKQIRQQLQPYSARLTSSITLNDL